MKSIRKNKTVYVYILTLMLMLGCFLKFSEEVTTLKQQLYSKITAAKLEKTNRQITESQDFLPMEHPENAWYQTAQLIVHAAGGIDGLTYTNSQEAMEQSLEKGHRVIELDFDYTADGVLVCVHEWEDIADTEGPMTAKDFQNFKIYGKYTSMTAENVIAYMRNNPQLHIVLDCKEAQMEQIVRDLVSLCQGDTALIERFIIQLYDRGLKESILQIYPFPGENFLFTAYKFGVSRYGEILQLCYDEDIRVITIPAGNWDQETVDLFVSKNIPVFMHTVNYPDAAREEIAKGMHGLYTDFLTEEDLLPIT